MKILFLGTSDFAVSVLDALAATSHSVALVVAAPDRPKGRGRKVDSPPIAMRARELELPLFQPQRINTDEALARLQEVAPDLCVVVAYGQILREPILQLAPRGIVNLHGSILPSLRGAAPIARAIEQGITDTGVTLQFVVREVDAGDVIDVAPMTLLPGENAGDASNRMSKLAAELLVRNLDRLADGTAPRQAQDAAHATYAAMLGKQEGRVPWARPAEDIVNHVRAMSPWPTAYTELPTGEDRVERIVLREVSVVPNEATTELPGTLLRADSELHIATGRGVIRIHRLLRSGRKELAAAEFLRGFPIQPGVILK